MQNSIKTILATCPLILLTACSSLNVRAQAEPIQQNLLTKCEPLSEHEGTTGAMVLTTMLRWASEYNDCAARHNGLVDAVGKKQEATD